MIIIIKDNWLNKQHLQFAFFIFYYKINCLAINFRYITFKNSILQALLEIA